MVKMMNKQEALDYISRANQTLNDAIDANILNIVNHFKDDMDVTKTALLKNPALLFYLDDFKNNKEVVMSAVKESYIALKYASQELKNDKEVVLEAIKNNPEAFKYASEELKNDKELFALVNGNEEIEDSAKEIEPSREEIKLNNEVSDMDDIMGMHDEKNEQISIDTEIKDSEKIMPMEETSSEIIPQEPSEPVENNTSGVMQELEDYYNMLKSENDRKVELLERISQEENRRKELEERLIKLNTERNNGIHR
jgi:DNA repair ATPase RecN